MEMASKKKQEEDNANRQAYIDSFLKGEGAGAEWEGVEGGKNLKLGVGAMITGTLITAPYKAGKSHAFDIAIGNETVTYWAQTILVNLLKKVREGDDIMISCVGEIATANGSALDFVVMKRKR
jgi:hypothetical protein